MINSFAAKYQDLYTSVPYVVSDMAKIRNEIEHSIIGFDHNCSIDVFEVLQAVRRLKPGKSDGYVGLSSRVANSPGLTRIFRVSAFDLRSSGLVLQSPG